MRSQLVSDGRTFRREIKGGEKKVLKSIYSDRSYENIASCCICLLRRGVTGLLTKIKNDGVCNCFSGR